MKKQELILKLHLKIQMDSSEELMFCKGGRLDLRLDKTDIDKINLADEMIITLQQDSSSLSRSKFIKESYHPEENESSKPASLGVCLDS
jgi:hypothetical protein